MVERNAQSPPKKFEIGPIDFETRDVFSHKIIAENCIPFDQAKITPGTRIPILGALGWVHGIELKYGYLGHNDDYDIDEFLLLPQNEDPIECYEKIFVVTATSAEKMWIVEPGVLVISNLYQLIYENDRNWELYIDYERIVARYHQLQDNITDYKHPSSRKHRQHGPKGINISRDKKFPKPARIERLPQITTVVYWGSDRYIDHYLNEKFEKAEQDVLQGQRNEHPGWWAVRQALIDGKQWAPGALLADIPFRYEEDLQLVDNLRRIFSEVKLDYYAANQLGIAFDAMVRNKLNMFRRWKPEKSVRKSFSEFYMQVKKEVDDAMEARRETPKQT